MGASSSGKNSAWRSGAGLFWVAVLAAVCGSAAYCQVFSTFRSWDDEGYVLTSLRNFAGGGALYLEVPSQYGPFFNLLFAALHRVAGMPLDTGSARWFVCGAWTAVAVFSFVQITRLTGSRIWGLTAGLALFQLLSPLSNEPLHPVGLIALLLTAGTALAMSEIAAGRENKSAVTAMVVGVLLALIKINVGMFYLAGWGLVALWSCPACTGVRLRAGTVAMAIAAGGVLMRPLLPQPWVKTLLLAYIIVAALSLTVLAIELRARFSARTYINALVAALVTLAGMAGLALVFEVGPMQLLHGVVLGPMRHPTAFSLPFRWSPAVYASLALNTVAFLAWLAWRRDRLARAQSLVALARTVAALGFLLALLRPATPTGERYLLSIGLGFFWAFAAPLGDETEGVRRARQFLVALALFQTLHVFPVAGTQVSVGTVLLGGLLMLGVAQTVAWLRQMPGPRWARPAAAILTVMAVIVSCAGFLLRARRSVADYARAAPETFTTARLRLPARQASTLATLVANARHHGDTLFSLPGMFSFNLWSNLPTPTQANITHWWTLLAESDQNAIAARLASPTRPVIIVERARLDLLSAQGNYHASLLTRFIEDNFAPLFLLDDYEYWVRRDAVVDPILLAQRHPADRRFSFYLPGVDLTVAQHLELHRLGASNSALAVIALDRADSANEGFTLTATAATAGQAIRWTCAVPERAGASSDYDCARFYDSRRRLLAEIRFPDRDPSSPRK